MEIRYDWEQAVRELRSKSVAGTHSSEDILRQLRQGAFTPSKNSACVVVIDGERVAIACSLTLKDNVLEYSASISPVSPSRNRVEDEIAGRINSILFSGHAAPQELAGVHSTSVRTFAVSYQYASAQDAAEALAAHWWCDFTAGTGSLSAEYRPPNPDGLASRYREMIERRTRKTTYCKDGVWYMRPPELSGGHEVSTSGTSLIRKYQLGLLNPMTRAENAGMFASDDQIIAAAQSALENNPNDGDSHLRLCFAYLRSGDARAFEHLAAAALIVPEAAEWLAERTAASECKDDSEEGSRTT